MRRFRFPETEMSDQGILAGVIYSILILTNVTGNSLVILVIIKSRSMKTPMNYLLLNLAIADLTAGVFYAPPLILGTSLTYPRAPTGDILCRLISSGALAWLGLYSSVFSLVFIAFDRYYAVMKPFSLGHKLTFKKLKIFIPVCWSISAIIAFPVAYFQKFDNEGRTCSLDWSLNFAKGYFLLDLLALGIVPSSIMIMLYRRVIRRLWFDKETNSVTLQAVRTARKKVTKAMLILTSIYAVCWLPENVRHTLEAFLPSHFSFSSSASNIFHSIVILNSTVNPFVYAFQFRKFRAGVRNIFRCRN